jgi:chromosome segregation ATPase
MTMHDPQSESRTGQELVGWLQDQVGALKAQYGRLQQQGDQTQAAILDVNEKTRDAEAKLREIGARTVGLPTMQEQMRQLSGLLERIQDTEVLIDTKFELLERTTHEERTRDQSERNDLFRRVQDMERRTEGMAERQATVDDTHRRFQEEVSRSHIQFQGINQRLEAVESKTGRNVDAVVRMEQTHAEIESAIRALRREDDVHAERTRLAHDVAARLETEMHTQHEEYRELPLLAERVELLRAERQRVEDRVSRTEETMEDAVLRLERQEEFAGHLDTRLKAHDARIDHVHTATLDYRRSLSEQLLKLNQMIERMKRRHVEELERDVKELRVQSNQLKNDDSNDF